MTEKLIPSLDSFELAFQDKTNWEKIETNWREGMESIYKQIISALKNSGIERIEDVKIPFNPLFHESIRVDKTTDKNLDHFVSEVFQVGYKIGDRSIRPAKVSIFEFDN